VPKRKGLIFAEEMPEVSPQLPKLPSWRIISKIAVKEKLSLSKKQKNNVCFPKLLQPGENSNNTVSYLIHYRYCTHHLIREKKRPKLIGLCKPL